MGIISGTVFEDYNANGAHDMGEPGLAGQPVTLERPDATLGVMKLSKSVPAAGDRLGVSGAVLGNNIVLGAHLDDTGATDAGAAYLFSGTDGSQLQRFVNPSPHSGDEFGFSVAALGGNVIIGARKDDTDGDNAGIAYLFDGAKGGLLHTFGNPNPSAGDMFGCMVAGLGEDTVAISATQEDAGATNAGAVYLFDAASGDLKGTIYHPTPTASAYFGSGLAEVDGNLVIGALGQTVGGDRPGQAFLISPEGSYTRTISERQVVSALDFG